uniref:Uncharacterized protein n=1 Tax=Wuchereria bancrofti TaxID=6293 RepID=A0AAF5Q397_WUCBA
MLFCMNKNKKKCKLKKNGNSKIFASNVKPLFIRLSKTKNKRKTSFEEKCCGCCTEGMN